MTDIDYDEMEDGWYGFCLVPGCGWQSTPTMRSRDADRDADIHETQHDDGVI